MSDFITHKCRPLREIRLCGFVAAQLNGEVLDGALCLDDFDSDGSDEVAVGTSCGRLSIFKYEGGARGDNQVCAYKPACSAACMLH